MKGFKTRQNVSSKFWQLLVELTSFTLNLNEGRNVAGHNSKSFYQSISQISCKDPLLCFLSSFDISVQRYFCL
jgi:hypothetical protein